MVVCQAALEPLGFQLIHIEKVCAQFTKPRHYTNGINLLALYLISVQCESSIKPRMGRELVAYWKLMV
jgi:hypothetical protein